MVVYIWHFILTPNHSFWAGVQDSHSVQKYLFQSYNEPPKDIRKLSFEKVKERWRCEIEHPVGYIYTGNSFSCIISN